MVKNCVAANCSNKKSPTVSLFNFPKDPELRQKWIKNVQRTRAEWKGPTPNSVLCSEHFESSCFEPCYDLAAKVGIATDEEKTKTRCCTNYIQETSDAASISDLRIWWCWSKWTKSQKVFYRFLWESTVWLRVQKEENCVWKERKSKGKYKFQELPV